MSKPKPTAEQQARTARVLSKLMLAHDPPLDDTAAAQLLGMDRGQWRRTRNGTHTPSLTMINRIAHAFHVDARDLSAQLASDDPHQPGTLERIEAALAQANRSLQQPHTHKGGLLLVRDSYTPRGGGGGSYKRLDGQESTRDPAYPASQTG